MNKRNFKFKISQAPRTKGLGSTNNFLLKIFSHSRRRAHETPSLPWFASLVILLSIFSLLSTFNFQLSTSLAHAQSASSQFTTSINTTGVDTIAPSVPTGLTAVPVSQSEIDLSWNPSTDNFYMGGYVVYRDGNAIATTTPAATTNFADTLLSASTTYTYAVLAFDTSENYSALSAAVSTSTLPVPIIPPTPTSTPPLSSGGGGSTSSGSSLIYNAHITADSGNAMVSFLTTLSAQSTVSYGLTPDYEIGSINSVLYDTSHQVALSNLAPEMHYYVRITADAANGSQSSFITEFTTAGLPGTPLPNPSNFLAIPGATGSNIIDLSWINTTDPRATEVRIVRSTTFFPTDQFDGVPVYEGPGQSFRDTSAKAGKTYYYAIFSEGANGLFSSGVLAEARIPKLGEVVSFATSTNPFAGIIFASNVNPMIAGLTMADFEFIQESKQLAIAGSNIIGVNGLENMTIRLPYNKVPQILKTIATTLNDPTDPSKAFIFLLRANADKTYYEASIGPLGRTGIFPLSITILDYQNQGLKQLGGTLAALVIGAYQYPSSNAFNQTWFWIGLALLIILLVIAAVWKRHSKNRQMEINAANTNKAAVVVATTILLIFSISSLFSPSIAHAAVSDAGLVGYWSMDEGTGTIAHDFSGKGNNGTIYGSTSWVDGKLSKALNFDGTSYAYVPASASLNPTSGSITVTVWLKDSGISQSGGCAHMVYDPGVFGITSTCNVVWINEPISDTRMSVGTTGLFDINQWTNVVLVYNKTTGNVIVYKNGTQFISQNVLSPGTSIYPTSAGVYVGGTGIGSIWNGDGKIDEIREYNRALSAADVSELYQRGAAKFSNGVSNNGLVGYWSMDEGTSTIAHDFSGKGNNGTLVNSPIWTNGKLGKALSFNGSNQYVNVGVMNIPTNITVGAWVYSSNFNQNGFIVGKNTVNAQWELFFEGPYLKWRDSSVSGPICNAPSDNNWHYVSATQSGTSATVYIDGVSCGSGTYSTIGNGTAPGTNDVEIGRFNSAYYYSGSIDEVRIYNRVLSATEISNLYKLGAVKIATTEQGSNYLNNGLVAYWPFNGKDINWTSGTTGIAYDRSGNGNNGMLTNMNQSTSPIAGKIGQALSFNGLSSYVSVVNSNSLNPVNLTVSVWAKSNTSTWNDSGFLVSKRNVYIIHPNQSATSVNFYIYTTGWVAVACTPSQPITNWNLYTFTWNGTNLTAYINGAQCDSNTFTGPINTSDTNELDIGKDAQLSRYFNGSIDEVRIYNRALSAAEVKGLYLYGQTVIKH